MAQGIVKLADNEYVLWSTVVDSPVSSVWWREAMEYVLHSEGGWTQALIDDHMNDADARGHSFSPVDGVDAAAFVNYNRAGSKEKRITLNAIRKQYAPRKRELEAMTAQLDYEAQRPQREAEAQQAAAEYARKQAEWATMSDHDYIEDRFNLSGRPGGLPDGATVECDRGTFVKTNGVWTPTPETEAWQDFLKLREQRLEEIHQEGKDMPMP